MTYYLKKGDAYYPSSHSEVVDRLPPLTYGVVFDQNQDQYYLERMPDMSAGSRKIYGDVEARLDRVFTTFSDRTSSTGVLLVGEKGSGKTMLVKLASARAVEFGMPTILVSQPHCGDAFNTFMKTLSSPALLVFDEFEKVYEKREKQTAMLSVFDGVLTQKHLIMVAVNSEDSVSEYFFNRPGRFFYRFNYGGLDEGFVREYCSEVLIDREETDGVVTIAKAFSRFNFDSLKAIVEEMNRYSISAKEAIGWMNVNFSSEKLNWRIKSVLVKNPTFKTRTSHLGYSSSSPLVSTMSVIVYGQKDGEEADFNLSPDDIVSYKKGEISYSTNEVDVVIEALAIRPLDVLSLL